MGQDNTLSRRATLAGMAGIAGAAGLGASAAGLTTPSRLPVIFLPHGGGPWPFVDLGMDPAEVGALASYLRDVGAGLAPKALLVISAHWEEPVASVTTSPAPPMLYDYFGFPKAAYDITWPAPGAPALADRVRALLADAGLPSRGDPARGFDHGTFVPLKLAWPGADVPTVQLSLVAGLDPAQHLSMGRALAPLRDEGVLIIGSGMTYHNMRGFGKQSAGPISEAFDAWLREVGTAAPDERDRRLAAWTEAPGARLVHPREEHLLPLMVVAGAAGADRAHIPYNGTMMGVRLSAYHFGGAQAEG